MQRTCIIAEIGVNHTWPLTLAKKRVKVMHKAGANAVKFQDFATYLLADSGTLKSDHKSKTKLNGHMTNNPSINKITADHFYAFPKICQRSGIKFYMHGGD